MHGGNHLNVSAGTAVSEWEAKSAHYRLIEENETREALVNEGLTRPQRRNLMADEF